MQAADPNASATTSQPPARGVVQEAARSLARSVEALRAIFGLRRRFEVDGVRYTERTNEPLHRAISRRGGGRKEFDVTFPDGSMQRIRCTPTRVYADVAGPELIPCYRLAEPYIRPGMRILDVAAGTGYGSAWLIEQVGPSGAIVALSRDRESVRYAQSRYRAMNIAYECGWTDALAGEIDCAFDAVVACAALSADDNAQAVIKEWWRLVAPNGWMLVVAPVATPTSIQGSTPGTSSADAPSQAATNPVSPAERKGTPVGTTAQDQPRVFAAEELSALIGAACKPAPIDLDHTTPAFKPTPGEPAEHDNEGTPAPIPAPQPTLGPEIAMTSIVDYTAVLVRKVARQEHPT